MSYTRVEDKHDTSHYHCSAVNEPFFKGIGQNAVVVVITVAVVLEFSAGATLCRGLDRGIRTVLAGSLAFFIEFIAHKWGRVFQAVFIGVSIFLVGSS